MSQSLSANYPIYMLCTSWTIGLLPVGGGSDVSEDEEEEGDEPLLAIEKRAKILDRKR
jgi:hypothetical protein